MPNKLLFLVSEDWYFVSHRLHLAIAARAQGLEVTVATREGKLGEVIRSKGIHLIPFVLSRTAGNPLRELLAVYKLYRKEQPDLVHHVSLKSVIFGSMAAWLTGIRSQVNALGGLGWIFTTSNGFVRMLRPLVRALLVFLLDRPKVLTVVQNPADYEALRQSGIPNQRLRLIPGAGVSLQVFQPADRSPLGLPVVMLAARMLWNKGVGEFVEAARILNESGTRARFVLVGKPDPSNPVSIPESTLFAWHGEHGIEWWGHRDDMVQVWQQAHIACLPSYREGMPKSLLEAAACGLPIVTTDVPGCRDVVEAGVQGLLVPARNASDLASAIKFLIERPELRDSMGRRSRARAEREFSLERVINATLMAYEELLA